jgi:hypothetical protein
LTGPGAPDLIESVVGFRKWRVVRDHLTSPYIPLRWDEPVVHARCFPANRSLLFGAGWVQELHDAPHPRCKCGVYAWHRPPPSAPVPDPDRALGVVSLWGRVEVHEDGMRAEHAAIKALGFSTGLGTRHERTMLSIAERLGVELVEERSLADAARRHGAPLPGRLLPGRSAA